MSFTCLLVSFLELLKNLVHCKELEPEQSREHSALPTNHECLTSCLGFIFPRLASVTHLSALNFRHVFTSHSFQSPSQLFFRKSHNVRGSVTWYLKQRLRRSSHFLCKTFSHNLNLELASCSSNSMKFEMQPVLVRGLFYRDLIPFFFFALALCKSPLISQERL